MGRASKARTEKSDEIPLARRYSPVRSKQLKRTRLLFGSLFITFFITLTSVYLRQNDLKQSILNNSFADNPLKESLLGHLPYKEAKKEDLLTVLPGLQVHKDTYNALMKMSSAAEREGIKLVLLSGFRTIELQKEIFYENKSRRNQIAIERAKVSAPPGYSEHSTGYAIDLGDGTMRYTDFEVEFETTPAFKWLKTNAAKYHFILSFPEGNSQGVSYEPWHWRFEGTVQALEEFKKANELLTSEKESNSP